MQQSNLLIDLPEENAKGFLKKDGGEDEKSIGPPRVEGQKCPPETGQHDQTHQP